MKYLTEGLDTSIGNFSAPECAKMFVMFLKRHHEIIDSIVESAFSRNSDSLMQDRQTWCPIRQIRIPSASRRTYLNMSTLYKENEKPIVRNKATGLRNNMERLESAFMRSIWSVLLERFDATSQKWWRYPRKAVAKNCKGSTNRIPIRIFSNHRRHNAPRYCKLNRERGSTPLQWPEDDIFTPIYVDTLMVALREAERVHNKTVIQILAKRTFHL